MIFGDRRFDIFDFDCFQIDDVRASRVVMSCVENRKIMQIKTLLVTRISFASEGERERGREREGKRGIETGGERERDREREREGASIPLP